MNIYIVDSVYLFVLNFPLLSHLHLSRSIKAVVRKFSSSFKSIAPNEIADLN